MLFLPTSSVVAGYRWSAPSSAPDMRLVPCSPPSEPLDAAPRTALQRDPEPGTDWEGFWSRATDAYYTRCTTHGGTTHWYRIADEGTDGAATPQIAAAPRVLPFR